MDNPYRPPATAPDPVTFREYNVRGGFYTDGEARAIDCIGAWLSLGQGYFRVKYLPPTSAGKIRNIFAATILLTMWFGVLGWLGSLLVYAVIKAIVVAIDAKKVEFALEGQEFVYDPARRIMGIRKWIGGQPVFIGFRPTKKVFSELVSDLPHSGKGGLKEGSRMKYQLSIFVIWLIGMVVGVMMMTMY